jgi:integrase
MGVMGCNIGLRASDLLSLRWCDIYDKEWNFLRGKKIKPKKTSNTKKKNKYVFLVYNESFRNALEEYRKYINITDMNDYIFESREGGHIQVQTAGKIIKNAAIDVGIKYNVNSHSMRKTLARNIYNKAEDKEDALVRIGEILGHTSTRDTRKYLCLVEEELVECFDLADFGYVIEEEENDD